MAHNHWPVGPEPQLRITSVCYSWCQSDGRGCPTRSREWGYAHRYGSGAHAEYSSGTAVLDSRWDGNGYKDGGQHSFAGKGFRSARKVAGEPSRRDHRFARAGLPPCTRNKDVQGLARAKQACPGQKTVGDFLGRTRRSTDRGHGSDVGQCWSTSERPALHQPGRGWGRHRGRGARRAGADVDGP